MKHRGAVQGFDAEEARRFFSRVRPVYAEMYADAHAVAGNCDVAEYAVQKAIYDCYLAEKRAAGYRHMSDSLRSRAIRQAYQDLIHGGETELTWDRLGGGIEGEDDPTLAIIAEERQEMRRMLALRYGCDLSSREIGRILGLDPERVHGILRRFEARTRRKMDDARRKRFDSVVTGSVRYALSRPDTFLPEIGGVYRTFQAEAARTRQPNRFVLRVVRGTAILLFAGILTVAFWFAAVLMRGPVIVGPDQAPVAAVEDNPFFDSTN